MVTAPTSRNLVLNLSFRNYNNICGEQGLCPLIGCACRRLEYTWLQAYLANETEDNKFNFQTCQFRINPKFYLMSLKNYEYKRSGNYIDFL